MVANIYECQFCNFTGGAIEAVRHRGESQHLIRIKPTEKWYPCCSGPTHAPWCEDYVERDIPKPDTWKVGNLAIHGYKIYDEQGREIVSNVYRKEDAEQIVTEHNQHQHSQSLITQLTTKLERQAETMARLVGERDEARSEVGKLREALAVVLEWWRGESIAENDLERQFPISDISDALNPAIKQEQKGK